MAKFSLLLFFVFQIAIFYSKADDVLSKHDPYFTVLKTAQEKLQTAKEFSLKKENPVATMVLDLNLTQQTFLQTAFHKLSESSRTFGLKAEVKSTELCVLQTQATIAAIMEMQYWALQMFDSTDKLPSGILEGHTRFYGSYDECLKVQSYIATLPQYKGQFCWAAIPVQLSPFLKLDLNTGICMPDSCSSADTLLVLNTILPNIQLNNVSLYATWADCKEEVGDLDTRAIAMLILCGFFAFLLICGTAYDVLYLQWYKNKESKEAVKTLKNTMDLETSSLIDSVDSASAADSSNSLEKQPLLSKQKPVVAPSEKYEPGIPGHLLLAFSIYTNGKKLLNTNSPPGTLTCINGIRFLSMSWVILGHAFAFGMGNAGNLNDFYPRMMKRWSFQAIQNALVSVDSFFALSGLLVAYLVLKEMKKNNGRLNWAMFYFHRFWRLTPPYMLILGVYVSLNKYWGDGPLWRSEGMENNYCESSWWRNLLYINNIVDNDDQCFGWAWYLANDMQFYILSPLMFVPLYFFGAFGLLSSGAFLIATFITTYFVSSNNKLGTGIGGATEAATGDYFLDYYMQPYCRIGPYVVGVITGYILYRTNSKLKMHWAVNLVGWTIATGLSLTVLYGLYDTDAYNGTPLSVEVAALYNATHRTVWGACLCWVIFACATGNGGFINTLLSWEGFSPLSRLTYCAYLVHPIVMYTYYQTLRNPIFYSDLEMIILFLAFLVASMMIAFVASLTFESPMMGLEKVIFRRGDKKK